jgi:hypothetical protein
MSPAIWLGSWTDPAILAEPPASGRDPPRTVGSWPVGRFPVNWPRSGRFLPDSGKDRRNPAKMARFRQLYWNLFLPNIKKIFLYYFILTFFILRIKFIYFN